MAKIPYEDELKTRISIAMKKALQAIADREGLDLSDIARRAFTDLLRNDATRNSGVLPEKKR